MPSLQRDRPHSAIEVLRLDRPERRNAIDSALVAELQAALAELAADTGLRVLVFSTTSTQALSAGADVGERLDREQGLARMDAFARLYAAVEAFPVPTIAVCVGHCVGAGAELAAGCDLRVAGDNVRLAWSGARLGVPVGPARLLPLVGVARAKELIFTGRAMEAGEAHAAGLLHAVVPAEEAEAAALALARQIAEHPPEGVRMLKAQFRDLDASADRVARENAALASFQRDGAGLPQGR